MIQIRRANISNFEVVLQLREMNVNYHITNFKDSFTPPSDEAMQKFREHTFTILSDRDNYFVYVAYQGTKPVGLIIFGICDFVNIHDIFVLEEFRGLGVASKLYNMIADKSNVKATVLKDNILAVKFYESKKVDMRIK